MTSTTLFADYHSNSGFPAHDHIQKTFSSLPDSLQSKPQIFLVIGGSTEYRHDTDRELLFRQESNFFYLTGCNIPSSILLAVYDPNQQSVQSILAIPKANDGDIMWSVPPPTLTIAQSTYNVNRVIHTSDLQQTLDELLTNDTLIHTLPHTPLYPSIPQEYLNQKVEITQQYLLQALQTARLTKDEHEIGLIRKANEISSRAHEVVMRVLGLAVKNKLSSQSQQLQGRPLLPGEWLIEKESEAEAIFVASCRREGAIHQAYCPIVAASTRAATLHYCCNDRDFACSSDLPSPHAADHSHSHSLTNPQLLLIDAGCEYRSYAADITRTMPLGPQGTFTDPARSIYVLVHQMQARAFEILKPGVLWDDVHLECHRVLVKGFLELGIFRKDVEEERILKSGISTAFFPHGLGHSLGLDVHDVPIISKPDDVESDSNPDYPSSIFTYLRLRLPLQPGMVVTVEPGIYFHPYLLEKGGVWESEFVDKQVLEKFAGPRPKNMVEAASGGALETLELEAEGQGIGGVRIEDVVVIRDSEEGPWFENLTTVRSDVEWIEGVCSGRI